ncbi:2TM domain-containing protein [Chitinophaga sp. Hz27]|uniref:2TM domain-containing protein n=1 Tax=Chitinophaga sp. Hz27 TaxID=3347169 RepID=UPI0035DB6556
METSHEREERLWNITKAKTAFKTHLVLYVLISTALWVVWFLTDSKFHGVPWPVWPEVTWGIILVFQYFKGYYKYFPVKIGKLGKQQHTRY